MIRGLIFHHYNENLENIVKYFCQIIFVPQLIFIRQIQNNCPPRKTTSFYQYISHVCVSSKKCPSLEAKLSLTDTIVFQLVSPFFSEHLSKYIFEEVLLLVVSVHHNINSVGFHQLKLFCIGRLIIHHVYQQCLDKLNYLENVPQKSVDISKWNF